MDKIPQDIQEDANTLYGNNVLDGYDDTREIRKKCYIQGRMDERGSNDGIMENIRKSHELLVQRGVLNKDGSANTTIWTDQDMLNALEGARHDVQYHIPFVAKVWLEQYKQQKNVQDT